jgi:catechol 2,3-dioxygenase-like lactoylglutathione lyase family enzyme
MFAAGGVTILVHEHSATIEGGPPNEDHLAVAVADLDAACDALREQAATVLLEPREYPWGRSAYVRDPDGRLVELAQG